LRFCAVSRPNLSPALTCKLMVARIRGWS